MIVALVLGTFCFVLISGGIAIIFHQIESYIMMNAALIVSLLYASTLKYLFF